jgi:hypothetical protein
MPAIGATATRGLTVAAPQIADVVDTYGWVRLPFSLSLPQVPLE